MWEFPIFIYFAVTNDTLYECPLMTERNILYAS